MLMWVMAGSTVTRVRGLISSPFFRMDWIDEHDLALISSPRLQAVSSLSEPNLSASRITPRQMR